MTEKSWKATERAIASKLGGKRVPVSGRGRGDMMPWHRQRRRQSLTSCPSRSFTSTALATPRMW